MGESSWSWTFEDRSSGKGASDDDSRERLDALIDGWDGLRDQPGTEVLKSNALRTVLAVPGKQGPASVKLIVKQYHLRDLRDRLKYLVVPSRARSEFRAIQHLRRAGISVPRPLAYGEDRRGPLLLRAGLVMEYVENTLPFPLWLEQEPDADARQAVLRKMGREVAHLHDAGCDHSDLHAGNILVDRDTGRVTLIDHHVIKSIRDVSESRRMSNLGKLMHSLGPLLNYAEKTTLIEAYGEACHIAWWSSSGVPAICEDLEERARKLEAIRLRSRTKRCWKNSSEFRREGDLRFRVNRRRELGSGALALARSSLEFDTLFKDRGDMRVGSVTSTPGTGEDGGVPEQFVVKEHRLGVAKGLLALLAKTPLMRAWEAARALDVREVPTPRAWAFVREHRWGFLPSRELLVTEFSPGAVSLHQYLIDQLWPPGRSRPEGFAGDLRRLAGLVRAFHDTGLYHRDLNPANILVAPAGAKDRFSLIDLDSVLPGRTLDDRRRRKNLVQLGLLPEGHVRVRDRLRFLRAYDRGEGRYTRKEWVRKLDDALAGEVARILVRMSVQALDAPDPRTIGDPRFGVEAETDGKTGAAS